MMRSESLDPKLQFALDPSYQISSDPTQASLLTTKLLDPWIRRRRERQLGWNQMMRSESLDPKLQFALDPSSQISSDPTQASLLTTKLGSMDQKKKRESLVRIR